MKHSLKTYAMFGLLTVLATWSSLGLSAACDAILLHPNKSSGTLIEANTCTSSQQLEQGARLKLLPGGRLWLTVKTDATADTTQLICQNAFDQALSITLAGAVQPWLELSSDFSCSPWMGNRMNCSSRQDVALRCVSAIVPEYADTQYQVQRTTSVTLRALPLGKKAPKSGPDLSREQVIERVLPEARLCQALYPDAAFTQLSWRVETDGTVSAVRLLDASVSPLNQCLLDMLANFHFPERSQPLAMQYRF
ncbi:MAG: hypothetical protein RQ715_01970 [Methylococcales bacterium]|nr:hypothetical protein [Methylococcales bacterium]